MNKVLFLTFALVTITLAQSYVDTIVIDSFTYTSPVVRVVGSATEPVSRSISTTNAGILGGESDQFLGVEATVDTDPLISRVIDGKWMLATNTGRTIGRMQYDGLDGTQQLNPTGLGGANFSGSKFFRLSFLTDLPVEVTIIVSDVDGISAQSSMTISRLSAMTNFYVAFTSFTPATINWSQIGSVQLQMATTATSIGTDASFDYFGLAALAGPANSICTSATVITSLPFSATQVTVEGGLDFSCSSGSNSFAPAAGMEDVWFSFTPSSTLNNVVISTCQSSAAFSLFLATGDCNTRTCTFGVNTPACSNGGDRMTVSLQAGVLYFIAASPKILSTATLVLDVGIYPSITCPPNVSKTALSSTCLYSASIGTPRYTPSNAEVSFSPTGPYSVGSRYVTYSAFYPGFPIYTRTCVQSVNVKSPVGSSC